MVTPTPTPTVPLLLINWNSEIVVRGGDVKDAQAPGILRRAYQRDDDYPGVVGISVLFRVGADVETLSAANPLPNPRLSHATVTRLAAELAVAGWAPVLDVTPCPAHGLPDHLTLAFVNIATGMRHEDAPPLPDEIVAALIRAMTVTENPRRKPRP